MALEGKAKRVRIYVNEGDRVGDQSTGTAVLSFLRGESAAGATVFRAVEGFGRHGEIHTARPADTAQAPPMVIEWIDSEERVDRLLPRVKELVPRGLITVDPTEVVLYEPYPVRRVSSQLTAADVMSHDVASVGPNASVRQVVELLLGRVYRALPVVDGRVPVGIITNSDLVTRGGLTVRMELLPSLEGRSSATCSSASPGSRRPPADHDRAPGHRACQDPSRRSRRSWLGASQAAASGGPGGGLVGSSAASTCSARSPRASRAASPSPSRWG
jgi:PII-like signaling protein